MGGIRQDTSKRKVFFVQPGNIKDTLLCDFSLSIGDTIRSYSFFNAPIPVIVSSIDSIFIGSNYRKKLRTSPGIDIIEGIGATWGLLYQHQYCFSGSAATICFTQNGQTIYRPDTTKSCAVPDGIGELQNNFSFKISPNPSSDIFTLSSTEKISSIEISDVLGNVIMKTHATTFPSAPLGMTIDLSSHPKGIYFLKAEYENGNFGVKKIVLK